MKSEKVVVMENEVYKIEQKDCFFTIIDKNNKNELTYIYNPNSRFQFYPCTGIVGKTNFKPDNWVDTLWMKNGRGRIIKTDEIEFKILQSNFWDLSSEISREILKSIVL